MSAKFYVEKQQVGQRLDLFIALNLQSVSRSNVRKLLDIGNVSVNNEAEYRPNYKVNLQDVVEVETVDDMQRKRLEPFEHDLNILYKDPNLVIAEKPAGMKVHPSNAKESDTFLNALYFNLQKDVGSYGVNLVNRIDKHTSGLVAAAVSATGAWHYAKQFADASVNKEYLAVVSGRWRERYADKKVRVGNFLNYDWTERKQKIDKHSGDYALTEFQLDQDKQGDYVQLRVFPKTGRTHQIRVHAAHILYPILGDAKYGGDSYKRLMLHAHKLELTSPQGEKISVTSEAPAEFAEAITPK